MHRRPRRGLDDSGSLVLVASDPLVIAAARDAARRLHGMPPVLLASRAEALSRLVGPGDAPRHLVLQHGATEGAEALLSAAQDRFSGTGVVVVANPGEAVPAGLRSARAEAGELADALSAAGVPAEPPESDAAALSAGLDRGEITVRFQPIVRMADRRPVLVEALARWERPGAALPAGAFIAMAEGSGLAARLTLAVARRAMLDLAAVRGGSRLMLSFNVPLAVLLRPELPCWLAPMVAEAGLSPSDLLLELTESTEVRDIALLRRALVRLQRAGFGVLLDDFGLDDARRVLLGLPFAGVKLDRSLVAALPGERRARAEVERLARIVHAVGGAVVAEGVTDPRIWRAAEAAGCDLAQGFGVGRPLPPGTLSAWVAAWRAAGDQRP
ncbi:EAL domain-containing protein [Falsiroseomonas sp. CW058]|uniref:EAL domain-containing protein n=1 Tax=Falsiroseomonas sp. CW058 TaxID=3388664 RepID=UPI003D31EFA5